MYRLAPAQVPRQKNSCSRALTLDLRRSSTYFTTNVVDPLTVPDVALIVVLPAADPVAMPVSDTVATEPLLEVHVTFVITPLVLFEYVAVATNDCVPPAEIVGFAGVTAIDVTVAV